MDETKWKSLYKEMSFDIKKLSFENGKLQGTIINLEAKLTKEINHNREQQSIHTSALTHNDYLRLKNKKLEGQIEALKSESQHLRKLWLETVGG